MSFDQRMIRTALALCQNGYDVTLVGFVKKGSIALEERPFQQKRLRLFFKTGKLFYAEYNLRLFFWLLLHRFDIYNAVDLDTLLPNYLVAKWKRKVLIHDAHEYFTELPEIANRPAVKWFWERLAAWLYPGVKNNITVGQKIAEELNKRYGREYTVIRNVPEYHNGAGQKPRSGKPVILYQGTLNKGRGLEEVIDAMENIDAQLWIAGEGDLSAQLRVRAASKSWNDRIRFLGYMTPDKLLYTTQQATIGLNLVSNEGLSYYYSLSNKFFDYIMNRVPQVTMAYPEYESLNSAYNVGLTIESLEPESIANSINRLLNDTVLYKSCVAGCEVAAQELNWDKEKEVLLSFYAGAS